MVRRDVTNSSPPVILLSSRRRPSSLQGHFHHCSKVRDPFLAGAFTSSPVTDLGDLDLLLDLDVVGAVPSVVGGGGDGVVLAVHAGDGGDHRGVTGHLALGPQDL